MIIALDVSFLVLLIMVCSFCTCCSIYCQFDTPYHLSSLILPCVTDIFLCLENYNTCYSEDNFDLNEDHTPELAKGEILCRALFLSVDPITSLYMKYGMSIGETFPGRQVARIVESRHKEFLKGKVN